jgi:regulator of PEP synthase PpsR (kinase-PPPase family)
MIVAEIKEAVVTITKAMVQIAELEKGGTTAQDLNQIVRWINTKEEHAKKIITTVAEYCLCQRVKREIFASESDFVDALKAHHAVMQAAMKCKQTVDVAAAHGLEHAVGDFAKMYKPQE